mmetsp:Transcript_15110/g.19158  ORF Transcript_15110/g.19158 Transcript_15110/m.19158 type:complete len:193 (-) Transcript_15110:299-877(-)|eukprot:CAMPEP_0203633244 /NCGR_PEP_ID=MMETSP0088-20131115/366_1 /ASSEMBLY_ACC=CAM_ASM_001087 /TAXON_ID=426623 /ORGANISM="Chaetoceros affinis, Strain CCMP159" /LENGTH=192 /DNA_ID=CAMNT_0050486497 /DNA_START=31 /DNA_END=609 /DNA_ORIENTATION=+
MFALKFLLTALLATSVAAFAPVGTPRANYLSLNALAAPEVDNVGNNVAVKELLSQVESTKLLSQVAKAGLLSKAQESGVSLTKLEPLLKLAASNKDVMILLEAAAPEALPILPKVVELAPSALPLLASAIAIPSSALLVAAVGSIGAAGAGVYLIPDDTVVQVAAQTLLVGVFGAAGAASIIGAGVLSKIKG